MYLLSSSLSPLSLSASTPSAMQGVINHPSPLGVRVERDHLEENPRCPERRKDAEEGGEEGNESPSLPSPLLFISLSLSLSQ